MLVEFGLVSNVSPTLVEKTHLQALLASSHSNFLDVSMLIFRNMSIFLLYLNLAGLYVHGRANITWNHHNRQYHIEQMSAMEGGTLQYFTVFTVQQQ